MSMCVELRSSRMPLPLSIYRHYYFVVYRENKTEPSRYDLLGPYGHIEYKKCFGHVYLDALKPDQGFCIIHMHRLRSPNMIRWPSVLHKTFDKKEGDALGGLLVNVSSTYPALSDYKMIAGPNSNSFVQWFLDAADINHRLPWNAWGKGYNFNHEQ